MSTTAAELGTSYSIEPAVIDNQNWMSEIRPLIVNALDAPEHSRHETPEDILDKILHGIYLLFLVKDGDDTAGMFIITGIQYPRFHSILIAYMAGKHMMGWAGQAMDIIEGIARENGHKRIEGITNDVLAKYAKRLGFNARNYIEKDLT